MFNLATGLKAGQGGGYYTTLFWQIQILVFGNIFI